MKMIKPYRPFGIIRPIKVRRAVDGVCLMVVVPFYSRSGDQVVTNILHFAFNSDFTVTESSTRLKGFATANSLRSVVGRLVYRCEREHYGTETIISWPVDIDEVCDGRPSNRIELRSDIDYEPHVKYRTTLKLDSFGVRCGYPVTHPHLTRKFRGSATT